MQSIQHKRKQGQGYTIKLHRKISERRELVDRRREGKGL
jgi:hypothetical protein